MNQASVNDKLINVGFFRQDSGVLLRVAGPEYMNEHILDFFRKISPTAKFTPMGRERDWSCYKVADMSWNPWSMMKADKARLMQYLDIQPRFKLLEHGIRGNRSSLAYFKMAVHDGEIPYVEMQIFDKKPEGFTVYFRPHDNPPKEQILKLVKCFKFRSSSTSAGSGKQALRSTPQRTPDNLYLYEELNEIVLDVSSGDSVAHPISWPVIKPRVFTAIKKSWKFLGEDEPRYVERPGMIRKGVLFYLRYVG